MRIACFVAGLSVVLVSGTWRCALADTPPRVWGEAQGNPVEIDGEPRWRLARLWPSEPTNAEAYRALSWNEQHGDWRDTEHTHGGMPRAAVTEQGQVRFVAGGAWPNYKFKRMPALTYIVPEDGVYGIAGKARPRVFAGLPPLHVHTAERGCD